jgi:hypothetical protein
MGGMVGNPPNPFIPADRNAYAFFLPWVFWSLVAMIPASERA